MEDIFKLDDFDSSININRMDKDEYLKKTQLLMGHISYRYGASFKKKYLTDKDYPSQDKCDNCTGCGIFKNNETGEDMECHVNYDSGDCSYMSFDSEAFINDMEDVMSDLRELLSVNEINLK